MVLAKPTRGQGETMTEWHFQTVLQTQARRGERILSLMIAGPPPGSGWQWTVLVVELAAPPDPPTNGHNPESGDTALREILADHAHEVLETQRTLADAMGLAERYAKWWQGSRASHFVCSCEPISVASERRI
jgi:hypothetical protein